MRRYILPLFICLVTVAILGVRPVHATNNVIYGSSTGLPADATIKQVTFSRSGDDLVTTFQVDGQISQIYEYYIGIGVYPTHASFYACILWKAGDSYACGANPSTSNGTRIQGTVQGNTWTAYTPFSMINGTQFWVFVGTYNPSTQQWVDSSPTLAAFNAGTALNFEVTLPTQVTFTIQPKSIANNVTLTVDGTQNRFDSNGQLTLMLDSGTSHAFTLTPTLQSSNDIRYVFGGWSVSGFVFPGSDTPRFVVELDRDCSLILTYKQQFLLTVSSEFGTVNGGGWYDEGSTAQFSVNPTVLKYSGFLGMLNVQLQFSGWTGDVASSGVSSSVVMDGPKTVQATWGTVYSSLFFAFVAVVGVPVVLGVVMYRRRKPSSRRRGKHNLEKSTRRSSKFKIVLACVLIALILAGASLEYPRLQQMVTTTAFVTPAPATVTVTKVAPSVTGGLQFSGSNWHLDAIAFNSISAGNPIQVSLTHSANCVVFVVVISVNQPNRVGVTSDFRALTYLAQSYDQVTLPIVTSYWTTSASAATGTIQVGWTAKQATAVIVAVSFIISGHTSFATENYGIANWSSGNPSTLTQGAGSNPNRLNVFMAMTFQNALTDCTVALDPTLTALTPIAIYEHPLTNYYVAVGWNVMNAQRSYSFTYANSGAIDAVYCGFDPL